MRSARGASQRAAASERSARGAPQRPAASERRAEQAPVAREDDLQARIAERICEAFAQTLTGRKGKQLLAAAQESELRLESQEAAYVDKFENAFFRARCCP